jgi:hypothetical protein
MNVFNNLAKNKKALGVAALVGAPVALLYMTRPKALHFVKVPAEREDDKVAEIKNSVKNRGHEQSKKLQDMYVDSKGTAWNQNQRIRDQSAEAAKQAADKDSTWFKYGVDKATENGEKMEMGHTDSAAWTKANELKSNLLNSAEGMKDRAKDEVGGFLQWGDQNFEKSDHAKKQHEVRTFEEAKKTSSSRRGVEDLGNEKFKDNNIMAAKRALEHEEALRSAEAAGDWQKVAPPDYWQDDDVASHDHTPFPQPPKVQGKDVMPSINEGVVPNKEEKEEAKKDSTAKRSISAEHDVKDNNVMASKAAVKEEEKNRSQHAAESST